MATQTVEFFAAPGQTVIAKLFSPGSDTQVASVTATEQTNRKGVYRAVYTDVPAGAYRLLALVGTTPIASWWTDLLLATGLYESYEIALSAITGVIYNAMPGAGWVNGSFGDRFLVSASAQRTVAVTGANHIAADIHETQPNVIDANALATDAVNEIAAAISAGGTVNIVVEDRSITVE